MFTRVILTAFIVVFGLVGVSAVTGAQSAIHEILGYMCLGFVGLYVGILGLLE
ncbi:MAG: hypothetical protein ACRC47_12675 [Shewanella sp.]